MILTLRTRLVARNAPFLSACNQSDVMISPTKFQRSTAPTEYRDKIRVVHDGIGTNTLTANTVLLYVNRKMIAKRE